VIARTAVLGVLLTLAAALIGAVAGPRHGWTAALAFGLVATGLQTAAVALIQPALTRSWETMMKRWIAGMALRLTGVVAFAVAVVVDRDQFPPLMAALGLVGVMVPLLFFEGRLLR
jgi:hypothetical protein